ncbi:hypothetical protein AXE80_03870 [Wenyingzhuangia fucanilytica]|uniref:ComEC/Rec2-related protein domain-containing protein n=2 Tax=Wenyingzhuangia fucanilytica TaxID=1790137 RepID=A0A1B1Y3Z8_9FLAO|nr:hypothetical protein AXE80_03870 [Wenyingzhuangia fucanilytica]
MHKVVAHQIFFFLLLLFGASISWFSQEFQNDLRNKNHYTKFLNKQVLTKVTLVKRLTNTKVYERFYADVSLVNNTVTSGKVLVEIPLKSAVKSKLEIGDVLLCNTNFKSINLPLSPYDFDYKTYLARKHVYAKIKINHKVDKIGESNSWFIQLQKLRNSVNSILEKSSLSFNTIGLIKAMLLGDKNDVTEEVKTSFTNSGVVHIIAISGMHVGVLYLMLLYTFGFLKRFKHGDYIYVVIVVMCLWSFAIFSGLSSSVIRSVTMFSFLALTKLKTGNRLVLESVISSMLLLLVVDANYLFDVGFQLSYAAVISIVVFYPLFSKWIKVKYKFLQYFIDVLVVSIIAQLGVLPLSLYYFHQIPLQFLFANFFAVSLLFIVLYGGIFVLIKLFFSTNKSFLENVYDVFITYYLEVIYYFSSFSKWIIKDISISKAQVLFYYVFLFCAWYLVSDYSYKRIKRILFLIIICQLFFLFDGFKNKETPELLIYNQYNQDLITVRNQKKLMVFGKDSLSPKEMDLLKENQIKNKLKYFDCVADESFQFKNENFLIINKKQSYHLLKQKKLILIMANNPKINFERLVTALKPKQVIIASSNYKNNQFKWKSTCKKLQVPFYCVSELGAYKKY